MTWAGDHLDDDTEDVDEATKNDGPLPPKNVSDIARNYGAEEGSAREDGDDQGLVRRREGVLVGAFDNFDELGAAIDTVDVTGVVTEEDTTEGGEGTDEVGFPGHWSLDAIDIVGGREGTNLAWHVDGCRTCMGTEVRVLAEVKEEREDPSFVREQEGLFKESLGKGRDRK